MSKSAKKITEAPSKETALSIIAPVTSPDATKAMTAATSWAGKASMIKVTDASSFEDASKHLVAGKQMTQQLESARKFLTGPLKDHIKNIEAGFKPTLDALSDADTALRQKLLAFKREEDIKAENERSALMAKAEAAQVKGRRSQATALATQAMQVTGAVAKQIMVSGGGTVTTKKRWTFEVTDAGAVPREYLAIDETKVRAAIRANVRDINGIHIFQADELAVGMGG